MAFYDIFSNNIHGSFSQKLLIYFNGNTLHEMVKECDREEIKLLEVGPGKGYFHDACLNSPYNIDYFALDRNKTVLANLSIPDDHKLYGDIRKPPEIDQKFDIIYAAYIIEHLSDGHEVFNFVEYCKSILKEDGVLVLLAPDSMRAKMEFWNIDYTHIYPTTPRNVNMLLRDAGYSKIEIVNNPWIPVKTYFWSSWFNCLAISLPIFLSILRLVSKI